MDSILAQVEQRVARLQTHPFIAWLADEHVPAQERLSAWLPCASFFVFGFMDLNAEVLRYSEQEASSDPLKQSINQHLAEDAVHWPWYLHDLRALGLDRTLAFTEALRFLWGKQTRSQRIATYRLCMLAERADQPVLRYCLLAALEAMAHVLFATIFKASAQLEAAGGPRLLYLGAKHLEREPGHLANQQDDSESVLRSAALDDATRARGLAIALEVCDLIEQRWLEFHRFAEAKGHAPFVAE